MPRVIYYDRQQAAAIASAMNSARKVVEWWSSFEGPVQFIDGEDEELFFFLVSSYADMMADKDPDMADTLQTFLYNQGVGVK